ncbi:tetratricopeptide repeat protein [Desulfovibrio sp. OttesenSCG-928-A18]|nr:tetratricopeptide repeat protein [Desulfovibrio sp. OttesenSCG-928-A18]
MANIETLRPLVKEIGDLQMQADGYALWLVWNGQPNPVVLQTLEEYGGIPVAEQEGQALWFFFSTEALLAAARLGVWARFNTLALLMEIFPARLQTGRTGGKNLIFDENLWRQQLPPPHDFRIVVHASLGPVVEASPGLSLNPAESPEGMDRALWPALEIDARLPYQSPLSWLVMLRPVGNVQDKNFMIGWREFFSQVEAVLQRNKIRFSVHDLFLMFPLESLRQLKTWCREFLLLVERLKQENPEAYWPCVTAVVDRKGLNINEDLPQKSGVEWDYLNPDYPHMSLRNASMLGDGFVSHEVRFARSRQDPEDWVSVSLREEDETAAGSLAQLIPVNLVHGAHPHCFYCGQHSHQHADCPSHSLKEVDAGVWRRVAQLDIEVMRQAVRRIDSELAAEAATSDDEAARRDRIAAMLREEGDSATMLAAFYAGNWVCQLRSINLFWRGHGKDFGSFAKDLAPMDGNPIWTQLDELLGANDPGLDKNLENIAHRFPRDFRFTSLRGFAAVQRGDLEKAELFWKDAEVFSPSPIIQAWHAFLQARSLECRGRLLQAGVLYDQVLRMVPSWHDAAYRKAVCLIKGGFSETALNLLVTQINRNGHLFNRALVDPELERGNIQVSSCLYRLWAGMEARTRDEEQQLQRMSEELATWFVPGHAFAVQLSERIRNLTPLASVKNFVAFQRIARGRAQLEKDMQGFVMQEGREYKNRFKSFVSRLKTIHDESAWFPFPNALVEFNKSYNEGVANLNWALKSNFHTPEAFRKAQVLVDQESARIDKLEGRLKFLRIVRDSTLFVLSVAECFFWIELVGTILIFAVLPLILLYGDKIGLDLAASLIAKERWQVQKALLVVVTILAVGIAGLRTLMRFETIRDKILAKARDSAVQKSKGRTRKKR